MSVTFKISELDENSLNLINKLLTLKAVDPEAEKRKYWKNAPKLPDKPLQTISMFTIIKPPVQESENKTSSGETSANQPAKGNLDGKLSGYADIKIKLPFRFACTLKQKLLNRDRNYPKVPEEGQHTFEGKLRDYQEEPLLKAYGHLKEYGTTTLGLPPGWGKTRSTIWLMQWTGVIGLVYITTTPLISQWYKAFAESYPHLAHTVWIVGEKNSPYPSTPNQRKDGLPSFIICMDGRYDKIPENIAKSVGCVIIDECHLFCTPGRKDALLHFEPKFVISLSATRHRDDGMHTMIESICGQHGVFMTSTTPYYVLKVLTNISVETTCNSFGTDFSDLTAKLASHEGRNAMILDMVKLNPHRKFIILTKLKDHAEYLSKLITFNKLECGTLYGTQKRYDDSKILIGSLSKIGVGFDEASFCSDFSGYQSDTLVFACSVKKHTVFEQARMRPRGKGLVVVYLVDNNKTIKAHFKGLEPWIRETNGTIVEYKYTPGTLILPASQTVNVNKK